MNKKLFLIGSPPASGKTFVAKKLAACLKNCVYLDKDTIIPLSKAAFTAANEPYNRDSAFFNQYVRDAEYTAILDVAFEAIPFNEHVILNAPFTKEFRDSQYIERLRERLIEYETDLITIWVHCDLQTIHQRMIERNSERDQWKLEHWDEYVKTKDNSIPDLPKLLVVENTDEAAVDKRLRDILENLI